MLRRLDKKMKRYINVKLLSILAFFFFHAMQFIWIVKEKENQLSP